MYVTELERRVFKSRQTDRFKVTTQLKQYTSKLKWKLNNAGARDQNSDDLNLASTTFGGLEEDRFFDITNVCSKSLFITNLIYSQY